MIRFLLLSLILLSSCEQPVVVQSHQSRIETKERRCTHTSYCFAYNPLTQKYGLGLNHFCPGTEKAAVEITPTTLIYPSKPDEPFVREYEKTISIVEGCH